jgi:plastocyanin
LSVLVVSVVLSLKGREGKALAAAGGAAMPDGSSESPYSPSKKNSITLAEPAAGGTSAVAKSGVFGKVTLSGPVPKLAPRPVKADVGVCGKEDRPSPSLVLSKDKELANAVVWLEGARGGALPKGPFRLDQRNCLFAPYVQVVSKGAPVVIGNSDPVLHNVRATAGAAAQIFNRAIPIEGQTFTETFQEPGVVRVKCDVHLWMTAWIFVADTPYAVVTDREGRFAFPLVPPGTYRLKTWHELFGEKSQPVTVPSSGAAKADVTLSLLDASD